MRPGSLFADIERSDLSSDRIVKHGTHVRGLAQLVLDSEAAVASNDARLYSLGTGTAGHLAVGNPSQDAVVRRWVYSEELAVVSLQVLF